jgi:hypothetical protein
MTTVKLKKENTVQFAIWKVRSVINEEGDLGTETGHPGLNS